MPIQFYTNGVPDITTSTRILGVCASHDLKSAAAPDMCGHFLSDFFALMHTFKGMGAHQTWMVSEDCTPARLMARYSRNFQPGYLFGDRTSSEARKVVLSPDMIEANTLSPITASPWERLKDDVIQAIKTESKLAAEQDQQLIIYILGYTSLANEGDISFSRGDAHTSLTLRDIKNALDTQADVTLITSSHDAVCWVVRPDLNAPRDNAEASRFASSHGNGIRRPSDVYYAVRSMKEIVTEIFVEQFDIFAREFPDRAIPNISNDAHILALYMDMERCLLEEVRSGSQFRNMKLVGLTFEEEDDEWARKYRKRTGYLSEDYKRNFDILGDFEGAAWWEIPIVGGRRAV